MSASKTYTLTLEFQHGDERLTGAHIEPSDVDISDLTATCITVSASHTRTAILSLSLSLKYPGINSHNGMPRYVAGGRRHSRRRASLHGGQVEAFLQAGLGVGAGTAQDSFQRQQN
jgi:hypothetical protein